MDSKSPHVTILSAAPGVLRTILAAATPEQFVWKPSAERWAISEVLTHLVDVELRVVGLRVRRIATEDNPRIESYDQTAEFRAGTYSGKDGREMLDRFAAVRAESVAFLLGLPDAAWQRTGRHPEVGVVRLSQFVNLWAFHDLGHIRQIAELYRAQAFWDGIGSLQRYYSVNP